MLRAFVFLGTLAASCSAVALATAASLDWAYPASTGHRGPEMNPASVVSLPGSPARYRERDLHDLFVAIDWWPATHGPLPRVVAFGRRPDVFACGYCHLPAGQGRPENGTLAGLPAAYITAQVNDMRTGLRTSTHPRWIPVAAMHAESMAVTPAELTQAAAYYARQTYVSRTKIVETAMIPAFTPGAFVYHERPGTAKVALGSRIIEMPRDFARFEDRDGTVGYVAYVPPGSIARGRSIATNGITNVPACESCHGAGLRGVDLVPPLAGRSPTVIARQLAAFHAGTRHAPEDTPMHAEVANLSSADLIAVAAYAGSLKP